MDNNKLSNSGSLRVHSVESFGTHDGPGIRLVIFLQGCNIKCLYCQNADTISLEGGSEHSFESLLQRAKGMKSYFANKGGITVSGGEPMLQSKQLVEFFELLKTEKIHTNIDTNGTINNTNSRKLISDMADLVMFDVKHTNPNGFKTITGNIGLKNLLENIKLREESKKPYWIRYVLVPGYTDFEESLIWLGNTFAESKYMEKLEILPYHNLGKHKWESLGWEYPLNDLKENTPEQFARVEKILAQKLTKFSIRY